MSSSTCTLFNLQRFSTEDGPGIRTTLFFKGCPLSCPWCHNPEGMNPKPEIVWKASTCMGCGDCVPACPRWAIRLADGRVHLDRGACAVCGTCADTCPTGARERVGTEYGVEELLEEVLRDRTFYETSQGGVTLSGGEPLMQHEFLLEFVPRCRAEGLHVALDTCGAVRGDWLEPVLAGVDLVLFDLKLIDPAEHKRLTGVSLDGVLANLDRVVTSGLPVWVRTPIIPGCTDGEAGVRRIAAYLKTHVPTLERYDLLAFSNLCTSKYEMLDREFALADVQLLSRAEMEALTEAVRQEGVEVVQWSGPTRVDPEAEAL